MQDTSLVQVIKKEITLANMENMETWIVKEKRDMEINARAMNTLFCAFCAEEFNRVSTCKTAKEIWDKFEVSREGNS